MAPFMTPAGSAQPLAAFGRRSLRHSSSRIAAQQWQPPDQSHAPAMGGNASAGAARSGSASAAPRTLEDVVALVMCLDPVANAKAAVTARIEGHGGRVVTRLGKEVSHIVWERTRSRRPSDNAADEAQLLELFHKLEKLEYPPVVVSPLWVEESIKTGRRLVERKFLVKKPTESLLGRTPGSTSAAAAAAAKKRKRPAAAVLPKPAEAYELDDGAFSSTQQMHNGAADAAAGPSNAGGAAKHPRRGGPGTAAGKQAATRGSGVRGSRGGRGAAPAAMATVVEDEEEAGWEDEEDGSAQRQAGAVGTETQAVANILMIDLPDEDHGRTPGGAAAGESEEEQDELDTPLALRYAKSSAERASAWGSGGSGRGSEERRGAAGGVAAGADRRSRLALASGPRQQEEADEAAAGNGRKEEAEPMEVEEAAGEQEDQQQGQQAVQEEQEQQQHAAKAAKGVAERFSVRQLVRHPERPVIVHKGTPLPGSLPSSPVDKPTDPIPIPVVERVTSPWGLAEELPTQSQGQAGPASAGPSARASLGQVVPRPGGRRSLLCVSNMRRASASAAGGKGTDATPASALRGLEPEGGAVGGTADKLPTPWSTLRPWDGKAAQEGAAAAEPAGEGALEAAADENQAGPPQRQQQAAQQAERPATAEAAAGRSGSGQRQRHGQTAEAAAAVVAAATEAGSEPQAGPTHGCIALTSVDDAVVDLAKSAVRRLRGLRLCPEGKEEGQVTHLVIGEERRTLKLMLAVANGAWLVSPQWVTASLEAGRWLPESQFPAKVRFEAAAERARSLLESPDAAPLLGSHGVFIHLPDKARKLMGANAAALKRVAAVLGAKAVPLRSCTLCVVVGGGSRPPTIPAEAICVKEEWLLLAAERFEQPPVEQFAIG